MRLYELTGARDEAQVAEAWRRRTAAVLRRASAFLTRLAFALERVRESARRRSSPELEFYAEAGAPEGSLYVDGQHVGSLPGVTRL